MAKKKVQAARNLEARMELLDKDCHELPKSTQCELLGIPRSTAYYKKAPVTQEELELMKLIDIIYLDFPYFGARRIAMTLRRNGNHVSRKRVSRLMKRMGISAIYQKPNTSKPNPEHKIYPYLLKGLDINQPNQVWCTDLTYIRLRSGWSYLMAVMDWHSRRVISWGLSSTMDTDFCVGVLEDALNEGKPEIFNTDQGSQFTSLEFTECLESSGIEISMDGKGRFMDNIFIERLWRSVKYECVYLNDFDTISDAKTELEKYFDKYNLFRPHQGLGSRTPDEVWQDAA
jgi:putative transposase